MGYIKEKCLSSGSKRFYAEVQLKGFPRLTATFDRKSDAKLWIQKTESEMRCGRNQLIAESRKHVFKDAVQRYSKEQKISVVKRGHLQWWDKELGHQGNCKKNHLTLTPKIFRRYSGLHPASFLLLGTPNFSDVSALSNPRAIFFTNEKFSAA